VLNKFLIQFLTLSLYIFFVGFCFCDGFKLHTARKLAWFAVFIAVSIYILEIKNEFDLSLILPLPTLLAILLCAYQRKKQFK
jgi:hypothetical protein